MKYFACSCVIVIVCSGCDLLSDTQPVVRNFEMCGFTYTSFHTDGFEKGRLRNAVTDLSLQISNSWIAICVFEFQQSINSVVIAPNYSGINPVTGSASYMTSTPRDIAVAVEDARSMGMKIVLKPHVDVYTGEWRAAIVPDEHGQWFTSYSTMMLKYAALAESLKMESLCIGTELVTATQPRYSARWRMLIDSVKKVFHGSLMYASNWNGAPALGFMHPEYEQIAFWDLLNYVGVDFYAPAAVEGYSQLPSTSEAYALVSPYLSSVTRLANSLGKKFVITEVGIQSVSGALSRPWDFELGRKQSSVADTATQRFYYSVISNALDGNDACAGTFWWNWESVVSSMENKNYTPRNKSAAGVLKKFYQRKRLNA